jgi:Na+-transporting NADH:ubiquinone oxidoreductase subunit NqrB
MFLVQFVVGTIGFILGFFNLTNIRFINENFWIFAVLSLLACLVYRQLRSRANYFHAKLQRFLSAPDQLNNV